ncbi:hypothetical protein AC1031_004252 [Aphanomyces cochlioides]|nr:hypothetical protein AC1031_004252 [Aphanomyces cochlioides]
MQVESILMHSGRTTRTAAVGKGVYSNIFSTQHMLLSRKTSSNPVVHERSEVANDFFFSQMHLRGKYEAMHVVGHIDKSKTVSWVHIGHQLGGPKGIGKIAS